MEPRNDRGFGRSRPPGNVPRFQGSGQVGSGRWRSARRQQKKTAPPRSAQPPRGLSGWMRNFAWRYPSVKYNAPSRFHARPVPVPAPERTASTMPSAAIIGRAHRGEL